jgi:hypothetical protein
MKKIALFNALIIAILFIVKPKLFGNNIFTYLIIALNVIIVIMLAREQMKKP